MKRLPRRICLLGGLLRTLYYRRVDILGTPCRDRPTLYLLSHRNGAIDGIVYQKSPRRYPLAHLRANCCAGPLSPAV